MGELGKAFWAMVELHPQIRAGRQILGPEVQRRRLLGHAPRPEPVDQNAKAVTGGGRIVNALDGDGPHGPVLPGLGFAILIRKKRHPARAKTGPEPGHSQAACGERRGSISRGSQCGQVAEWLKAHAWKVCNGESRSRVRIPLCPPKVINNIIKSMIYILAERIPLGLPPSPACHTDVSEAGI